MLNDQKLLFYGHTNPLVLLKTLADVLRQPLQQPLAPEWLVVDSPAQKEWLSQFLAETFGISANCMFPFPRKALWRLLRLLLPAAPSADSKSISTLTWELFSYLPQCLHQPEFQPVAAYLRDENHEYKLFVLCQKLAVMFDRYPLYRPALIAAWDAGKMDESPWQACLWRHIYPTQTHALYWQQQFLQRLHSGPLPILRWPERLCVFGLQTLPPFYVELLVALSSHCTIHLFQWCVSDLDNHPLLAGNGRLSRHYRLTLDSCKDGLPDVPIEPPSTRLAQLHQLLRQPDRAIQWVPECESIQVHAFHSPLRELEGLRNYLLHRLEQDPNLRPRDIAIMVPSLTTYQSLVPWIFPPHDEHLPVKLLAPQMPQDSHWFKAIVALFHLVDSRLTLPDVLGVLEMEAIYPAFELSIEDVWRCRQWLDTVHVRWGIDGAQRQKWGLPAFEQNTWQQGLSRLLLGYALPPHGEASYSDYWPYAHIEGQEAQILGHLLDFTTRLFAFVEDCQVPKTRSEWVAKLRLIPTLFLSSHPDWESDKRLFEHSLRELEAQSTVHDEPVSVQLVQSFCLQQWQIPTEPLRLGYQIAFGTLADLRGWPFKVVCVLGLNEGQFPSSYQPLSFDLMAPPQAGDAWPPWLERDLFLQAICAAQTHLYLSYQGQRLKDNSEQPPSLLLNELFATITGLQPVRHPLHPFASDYFHPATELYSYNPSHHAISQLFNQAPVATPFFTQPFTIEPAAVIDLTELKRFLRHPVKYWMQHQLQLHYLATDEPLAEAEYLTLNQLEQWHLKQELLDCCLKGQDLDAVQIRWVSQGLLPVGQMGQQLFAQMRQTVERFAHSLKPFLQPWPTNQSIALELGTHQLAGHLDGLQAQNRLAWRLGPLREVDVLEQWVSHLALCASQTEPMAQTRMIVTKITKEWDFLASTDQGGCVITRFPYVSQAKQILTQLIDLYHQGQTRPLPFFPRSSWAHICYGERNPEKVSQTWMGSDYQTGEGGDPWLRRCYWNQDPFSTEFQTLAQRIYGPIQEALTCRS